MGLGVTSAQEGFRATRYGDSLGAMIISRGRRYIFVHIPKTAGTALSLALEARAKADDILIGDTPKAKRRKRRLKEVQTAGRLWKHSRLADIEGLVDRAEFSDLFLLTLVRNPWDRVVSYYHWLRVQNFDHPAVALSKTLTFDAFVKHPHLRASLTNGAYPNYMRDGAGHEHQASYIRIEHLEQDLSPFEAHLGFSLGPVDRVNASDRAADYRGYYTAETADLIGQICASDITRFGYSFDPK